MRGARFLIVAVALAIAATLTLLGIYGPQFYSLFADSSQQGFAERQSFTEEPTGQVVESNSRMMGAHPELIREVAVDAPKNLVVILDPATASLKASIWIVNLSPDNQGLLCKDGYFEPSRFQANDLRYIEGPLAPHPISLGQDWVTVGIAIEAVGFHRSSLVIPVTGGNQAVTVNMKKGVGAMCQVHNADGAPLVGVEVRSRVADMSGSFQSNSLESLTNALLGRRYVTRNPDAAIDILSMPEGYSVLHAYPERGLAESIEWYAESGGAYTLTCMTSAEVFGEVESIDGTLISGVRVAAYQKRGLWEGLPLSSTETDESGKYTLLGLPAGPQGVVLFAERPGWSLGRIVVSELDPMRQERHDFILTPAVSSELVIQGPSGRALAGCRIRLEGDGTTHVPFSGIADDVGRVELGAFLVPGASYAVQLVVEQICGTIATLHVPSQSAPQEGPLLVQARGAGYVEFVGLPETGEVRAELEWTSMPSTGIAQLDPLPNSMWLPIGDYSMTIEINESLVTKSFAVRTDGDCLVSLDDVPHATVALLSSSSEPQQVSVVTADGVYVGDVELVDGQGSIELPLGVYIFCRTDATGVHDSQPVTIAGTDERVWVDDSLFGVERRLRGTVIDESGRLLSGAGVTVFSHGLYKSRSVTTDENGGFELAGLPFGIYQVRITGVNDNVVEFGPIDLCLNVMVDLEIEMTTRFGLIACDQVKGDLLKAYTVRNGSTHEGRVLGGNCAMVPMFTGENEVVIHVLALDGVPQVIRGIFVSSAGDVVRPRFTSQDALIEVMAPAESDRCPQDHVALRVLGMDTGFHSYWQSAQVAPLFRCSPGLRAELRIQHEAGRVSIVGVDDSASISRACKETAVGFPVQLPIGGRAHYAVLCCGIQGLIERSFTLNSRCTRSTHQVVVVGGNIVPYSKQLAAGDTVALALAAESLTVITNSIFETIHLVPERDKARGTRIPLLKTGAGRWRAEKVAVGEYLVLGFTSSYGESLLARVVLGVGEVLELPIP